MSWEYASRIIVSYQLGPGLYQSIKLALYFLITLAQALHFIHPLAQAGFFQLPGDGFLFLFQSVNLFFQSLGLLLPLFFSFALAAGLPGLLAMLLIG